jgi:cell division protein FtsB
MATFRAASTTPAKLRSFVPTLIVAALCLYFAFYLLFGPRGLFALDRAQETLASTRADYALLKNRREKLEADVKLMRPDSLDPDMAEEQARRTLGYMKQDEIVIDLN